MSALDGAKSAPERIGVLCRKKQTPPLINAGEGSEQCLNIVLVYSTEGGIKGDVGVGESNLELAAISNHTFFMFIPLFLN